MYNVVIIVFCYGTMYRILVILIIFNLPGCSTYTAASLSANVLSVTATGKTNADLVISYLAGKDCKMLRITLDKNICEQSNSSVALKEEKNKIVSRYGKIIDTAFFVTKNVAKDHAILGAKIVDKIGITNELEEKVTRRFENTGKKENLLQKQKYHTNKKGKDIKNENKKNKIVKKNNSNIEDNEITWKQRLEKVKIKRNELVEEVKIQKKEIVKDVKIKSKKRVDEAVLKSNEFTNKIKVKRNKLVDEAVLKSNEFTNKIKVKRNKLVDEVQLKKNKLEENVKTKRKELKENLLKNIKKIKLYDSDSNNYALSTNK